MGAIVLLTEVLLLVAAPILIVATEAELAEPAQPALFQLDSEGESVITFGPKDKNATVVLSSVFGSNKLDVSGSLDAQDLRVNGTSVAELMAALEAKIIAALPAPSSPSPELLLNIDPLLNYCAGGGDCENGYWGFNLAEQFRDQCLGIGVHGRGSWWKDTNGEKCKMPSVGNTAFLHDGEKIGIGLDGPAVGAKVTEVAFAVAKYEGGGAHEIDEYGSYLTVKLVASDGTERYTFASVSTGHTGRVPKWLTAYSGSNRDRTRAVGDQTSDCTITNAGCTQCGNQYGCTHDEFGKGFRWIKFWGADAPPVEAGDRIFLENHMPCCGSDISLAVAKGRWENENRMPGMTFGKWSGDSYVDNEGRKFELGDIWGVANDNKPFRCCSTRWVYYDTVEQKQVYYAGNYGACAECKDLPAIKVVGVPGTGS